MEDEVVDLSTADDWKGFDDDEEGGIVDELGGGGQPGAGAAAVSTGLTHRAFVHDSSNMNGDSGVAILPTAVGDETEADRAARVEAEMKRHEEARRAGEERARERAEARMAMGKRILHKLGRWGLVKKEWLATTLESGLPYPPILYAIQNNWRRWGKTACTVISAIYMVMWMASWVMGSPYRTLHDGTVVVNMWEPVSYSSYYLSNAGLVEWMGGPQRAKDHVTSLSNKNIKTDTFEAHVYKGPSKVHNISIHWMHHALEDTCGSGNSACDCIVAVELGVLANMMYTPSQHLMLNTRVTAKSSSKLVQVKFDDGTEAKMPMAIKVEYTTTDGTVKRATLDRGSAFCVARSLQVMGLLEI